MDCEKGFHWNPFTKPLNLTTDLGLLYMTFDQFISLLSIQENCPVSLPEPLQALWYDRKGDWQKAHEIVQNAEAQIVPGFMLTFIVKRAT